VVLLGLAAGGVAAQGNADAERARRDAEKVFSFIKFHAVKKPAAPAPAPPPAPARESELRPAATARALPPRPAVPPTEPPPANDGPRGATAVLSPPAQTAVSAPALADAQPLVAPAAAALLSQPALPTPLLPPPIAAPAAADDEEEAIEIKLREFVAPELSPSVLATLGASNPRVRMRFTVEPDGKVSQATAREGTPRRLAQVASRAILQWRFEPIALAQEVEVELAFKRD
jgi:protein TonB